MRNNTIERTLKFDLCCGCGICSALCPSNIIKMKKTNDGYFRPKIKYEKCTNCGICLDLCPGYNWDSKKIFLEFFSKLPENSKIGISYSQYFAHTNNKNIYDNASSGGIVSSIIEYLFKTNQIKGAVVTIPDENDITSAKMQIIENFNEITKSQKSKYTPVHMAMVIKQILQKDEKFAFVGLPCHIQALRKAQLIFPKLKDKIVIIIGILCGHNISSLVTAYQIHQNNCRLDEIQEFQYRARGWDPFDLSLKKKNGTIIFEQFNNSIFGKIWINFITTPKRCQLCNDLFAETSDISCGDAWLPEFHGRSRGKSLIITRNKISDNLIQKMNEEMLIEMENASLKDIERSQIKQIEYKKDKIKYRLKYFHNIPKYGINIPVEFSYKILGFFLYRCVNLIAFHIIKFKINSKFISYLWKIIFYFTRFQ